MKLHSKKNPNFQKNINKLDLIVLVDITHLDESFCLSYWPELVFAVGGVSEGQLMASLRGNFLIFLFLLSTVISFKAFAWETIFVQKTLSNHAERRFRSGEQKLESFKFLWDAESGTLRFESELEGRDFDLSRFDFDSEMQSYIREHVERVIRYRDEETYINHLNKQIRLIKNYIENYRNFLFVNLPEKIFPKKLEAIRSRDNYRLADFSQRSLGEGRAVYLGRTFHLRTKKVLRIYAILSPDDKVVRLALYNSKGHFSGLKIGYIDNQIVLSEADDSLIFRLKMKPSVLKKEANFSLYLYSPYSNAEYDIQREVELFKKNGVWRLVRDAKVELPYFNLQSDRVLESNELKYYSLLPLNGVVQLFDIVFLTLPWNFTTTNFRVKKIAEAVLSAADDIPQIRDSFDKKELEEIAEEIAEECMPVIGLLSGNKGCYRVANETFLEKITFKELRAKIKSASITDREIKDAVEEILADAKTCLRKSEDKETIDICRSKYERSSPYRAGKKILKFELVQNLRENSIDEKWIKTAVKVAERQFDKCGTEYLFFNYFRNLRIKKRGYDPIKDVVPCVYSGLHAGIVSVIRDSATAELKKYGKKTSDFSLELGKIQSLAKQCFHQKGIFIDRDVYQGYFYKILASVEQENFKADLINCIDEVKALSGEIIVGKELRSNTELIQVVGKDNEALDVIVKKGLAAYRTCIESQKSLNPERCRSIVELAVTRESILYKVKATLNEGLFLNSEELETVFEEIQPSIKACFDNLTSEQYSKLNSKRKLKVDKLAVLKCVKEAVATSAYYLSKVILKLKIKTNPELKNFSIKLTDEQLQIYQQKGKNCFAQTIASLQNLDAVLKTIPEAKKTCTSTLYKIVLPDVIPQVLEIRFKKFLDDEIEREKHKQAVFSSYMNSIIKLETEEEIDASFQQLKVNATLYVMEVIIKKQLLEYFPETKTGSEAKIRHELKDRLLNKSLEESVAAAYKSGVDRKVDGVIGLFQITAAKTITAKLLPYKIGQYVDKQDVLESLTETLEKEMHACLDKIDIYAEDTMESIEDCRDQIMNRSTWEVVVSLIEENLDKTFKLDLPILTKSEKEKLKQFRQFIREKVFTDELKKKIHLVNQERSDAAMTDFKNSVYMYAAPLFASKKIEFEIVKSIPEYKQKEQLLNNQTDLFEDCLQKFDLSDRKAEIKFHVNRCTNEIVLDTTKKLVKIIFTDEASEHFPAEAPQNYVHVQKSLDSMNVCLDALDPKMDSAIYTEITDSCVAASIYYFAYDLVKLAYYKYKSILDLANFEIDRSCFAELAKKSYLETNYSPLLEVMSSYDSNRVLFQQTLAEAFAHKTDFFEVPWMRDQVKSCADDFKKSVFKTLKKVFRSPRGMRLNMSEKELMDKLFKVIDIFGEIKVKTSEDKNQKNQYLELSWEQMMTGQLTPKQAKEASSTQALLEEQSALIASAIKKDKDRMDENIDELLKQLEEKLGGRKEVDLEEILDLVVVSKLLDTIIKTKVALIIREKARGTILSLGLPGHFLKHITTLKMLDHIFLSPKGREARKAIVQDYILPMVRGEEFEQIPENVERAVIMALTSDYRNRGFSESILAEVAQKKINDQVVASGLGQNSFVSRLKGKLAWIMGYRSNDSEDDFGWSTYNGSRGLRDTPSGHQAIRYFADWVLPFVLTDPSFKEGRKDYDRRVSVLEKLILKAQSENSGHYSIRELEKHLRTPLDELGISQ